MLLAGRANRRPVHGHLHASELVLAMCPHDLHDVLHQEVIDPFSSLHIELFIVVDIGDEHLAFVVHGSRTDLVANHSECPCKERTTNRKDCTHLGLSLKIRVHEGLIGNEERNCQPDAAQRGHRNQVNHGHTSGQGKTHAHREHAKTSNTKSFSDQQRSDYRHRDATKCPKLHPSVGKPEKKHAQVDWKLQRMLESMKRCVSMEHELLRGFLHRGTSLI
mmetsp:Transcript_138120/g.257714  ORF Transcript_138120/g.257714 Transcript_138120/m.257714 type:complete len:219 (+) Transcript_138120:538-1194(+)